MRLATLAIVSFLCIATPQTLAADAAPPDNLKAVTAANNAFAADLYAQLRAKPGNLFFSPLSISTALAMTEAGTAGNTRQQMRAVLHLANLDADAAAAGTQQLDDSLRPKDKAAYQLSIANALWGQAGFAFRPDYLRRVETIYGGTLRQVDFAQSAAAAKVINTWVEEKTNQKIKDLVPASLLGRDTRLVLTNAVYFKGDWASQFKEAATKDQPFAAPGGKVNVPLMHQLRQFSYAETPALQVLQLPYAGDDLAMLVLLPRNADGLADLERSLTADNLDKWGGQLQRREVDVHLPRFKLTHEIGLNSTLIALGMSDAFGEKADFSGMTTQERLCISDAIHKAFVDVNEQGTEAAAATAIVMRTLSVAKPSPPVVFRADHPFVFAIRDVRSGAILFLGRLTDPKE